MELSLTKAKELNLNLTSIELGACKIGNKEPAREMEVYDDFRSWLGLGRYPCKPFEPCHSLMGFVQWASQSPPPSLLWS